METPNLPAIRALRPAWNKGRIVGQKRPLKPKHVWAIRVRLELAENHRDLALFNMAIDSKLRGCDLVKMKVVDVMASGQIEERASVLQSKTQKPVRFEISEGTRASVEKWMEDELMIGSSIFGRAAFTSGCTSQHANMLGSSGIGSHRSDLRQAPMGPIRCDEPKLLRYTRRRAICVPFSSFWAIPRWTVRSDTLASNLRMP
ncbi:hypothetical protein SAMN05444714_0200 [Yoonia litorea]|uniref:Phage integrase family protein n=1 Tax=Yoonia litorea TaxID=1123755 RepID=A0A1I6L520_9RHOB|nr:hypothetical protein SAMN05444714_0200 [Yoonia litorea]